VLVETKVEILDVHFVKIGDKLYTVSEIVSNFQKFPNF